MFKSYPYLKDINFLNKIYGLHNKTIYTQITILDWQERELTRIEGKVLNGSLSINGDSAVRRTSNLSIIIENQSDLYGNSESLFSLNKKIFLELGIKNTIGHLSEYNYPNYSTIWFPFGVYIIQNSSLTHDISGLTLSLTLGDKMCLLNGEAGGTIPSSTNFESYDTLGPDGDLHTEPIRINQIIPELVNHFGNESLNNIIVSDIEDKIKQVMKWQGSNLLYIWEDINNPDNSFYTTIEYDGAMEDQWRQTAIKYNYDAGYTYVDFIYPGELVANPGDSVCTVLDKIKSTLGNYEYYYDVFGHFIFQEIKNYISMSEWRTIWRDYSGGLIDYLPYAYNPRLNSAIYDFNNNNFIISYNNSPQFNMIKNDFIVWGKRKSESNNELACRYHLAIDKRPFIEDDFYITFPICFDTNVNDRIRRCFPLIVYQTLDGDENSLKSRRPVGTVGEYYYIADTKKIYAWITDIKQYKNQLNNYLNSVIYDSTANSQEDSSEETENSGYVEMTLATYYGIGGVSNFKISPGTDWRNILYFQDFVQAQVQGSQTSYYWAEMYNEWPKIYDIEHDTWIEGVLDSPSSLDWWLDLIDNDVFLNQFSIDSIGRRSYAKVESGCNCVFEPDIPDNVLVNVNDASSVVDSRSQMTKHELEELGLHPIQVSTAIYDSMTLGGSYNSCYQNVRQLLTNYTDYNENITINCIPIYHLEPNTRIHVFDPEIGINGDFVINSISFDLSNSGTMNINAKKVIEKI